MDYGVDHGRYLMFGQFGCQTHPGRTCKLYSKIRLPTKNKTKANERWSTGLSSVESLCDHLGVAPFFNPRNGFIFRGHVGRCVLTHGRLSPRGFITCEICHTLPLLVLRSSSLIPSPSLSPNAKSTVLRPIVATCPPSEPGTFRPASGPPFLLISHIFPTSQACLACRKRKLVRSLFLESSLCGPSDHHRLFKKKCDAGRPHCTTCVKYVCLCRFARVLSHSARVTLLQTVESCDQRSPSGRLFVSPYASPSSWVVLAHITRSHPTEPQCSYDPVDGLPLAPDTGPLEKIKALEEQLSEWGGLFFPDAQTLTPFHQDQLRNQLRETGSIPGPSTTPSIQTPAVSSLLNASPELSPGVIVLPSVSLATAGSGSTPGSSPINNHSYPINSSPSPPRELLIAGWNPDLPPPTIVNHLIDVFFKCDPCGSRILHRPSFMAAMQLPAYHSKFPHVALLHAIVSDLVTILQTESLNNPQCASASRWTSNAATITQDGARRDKFAEFHASKTRQYIDRTMASGKDIFQVMQACIVLSWYLYQEGRWVEVWIYAGFQTRVAIPLRLNFPGTFSVHAVNGPGEYLPPPQDPLEQEIRRRTWWMTILFDRTVSVGGWVHAVGQSLSIRTNAKALTIVSTDERDIGTELPLTATDFELQVRQLFYLCLLSWKPYVGCHSEPSRITHKTYPKRAFSFIILQSIQTPFCCSSRRPCYLVE